MTDESSIIKKFNEAFLDYKEEVVIDLDRKNLPKLSFHIYHLEDRLRAINGLIPPNRESLYYIALIKKGQGTKTIGYTDFPIEDNMLMIIQPRTIHAGRYTSADYCGYVLCFSLEYFLNSAFPKKLVTNRLIFKSSLKPYLILSDSQVCELECIMTSLLNEHENAVPAIKSEEMIMVKVLELLIVCDRFFTEANLIGTEVSYPDLVDRFYNLVERDYMYQRTVQYYANALQTHPNNLNAIIKKHSGRSAKEVIVNKITLEAKYYLANSSLSIKEISNKLGFSDPNYFSYFFKKETNLSPVAYR